MSIQFKYNYPKLAREAGFRLRQYKDGPLDWRLLGTCEIERLLRDQCIEDIDKLLEHLAEAPIGKVLLDTNVLDPAIAKYFIVSQFAIQYLLFCRSFLDETVQELRESHAEAQLDLARVNKSLTEANNEILQLHKKMTQMEAMHEVIYPCHLCTKNFANNEALNIHIGRKHGNTKTITTEQQTQMRRSTETPNSGQKERSNDLALINTIKLELEIKQLKERLNNAEKDIKERKNFNKTDQYASTPQISTRNIAIQSNLSEEKEKNESYGDKNEQEDEDHERTHSLEERKHQLDKLQSKIYDIEEWRATQMANNEDSIAEIKRKLNDIVIVLERAKIEESKSINSIENEFNEDIIDRALERRLSVENLERVLSEKVAEIGKASTEKLEKIVYNLESNYREKLIELEREVKKTRHDTIKVPQNFIQVNEPKFTENVQQNGTIPKVTVDRKVKGVRETVDVVQSNDDGGGDGTYSIEKAKVEIVQLKAKQMLSEAVDGKHTIPKRIETRSKITAFQNLTAAEDSLSEDTNVSESLSDDEKLHSDDESKKPNKTLKIKKKKKPEKHIEPEISKVKFPKKYTRKDAKNLASKRLSKIGCDMRIKSLTNSSFKRLKNELHEKRLKVKQQHPNFYATRNRIKKFVDKLCTTKSMDKAERMITTTPALQPIKMPKLLKKQNIKAQNEEIRTSGDNSSDYDDDNDDDEEYVNNIEDNRKEVKSEDFKMRLERLLASPLQRPLGIGGSTNATTTIVQLHNEEQKAKPMPLPRKRVMFTTSTNKAKNTDLN